MKRAWIFDLDGTLANGDHRIHHIQKEPKDWRAYFAACGGDAPIYHMIDLCNMLFQTCGTERSVVIVSGRSDEVAVETIEWLRRHRVDYDAIYMRKAGDHKPDDVLKIELLAQVRADGYEPIMVFDDRDRVVKAWRDAGIPCAQVAPGDF